MSATQNRWLKLFLLQAFLILFTIIQVQAVETAAPNDPAWGKDPLGNTLLRAGTSINTFGVRTDNADGDHVLKLFDTSTTGKTNNRTIITPDTYTHHHWDVGSIGNVYGLALDNDRNMYTTASVHWASGYYQGGSTKIGYGEIGEGTSTELGNNSDGDARILNSTTAAGAVYKLNAQTGDAELFATLPQTSVAITHRSCEGGAADISRNAGPGLGNIAYDKMHNQFFVSNFSDGRIYRLAPDGTVLSVFDTPFDGMYSVTQSSPYGLAVSPDGTQLFYGTNELNVRPQLFAINLNTSGDFTGASIDQHAKLVDDLEYTENIGGQYVGADGGNGPIWTSYSDLDFTPNGELVIGTRVGCLGNPATSYNHGGSFHLLKTNGAGLYNVPADQVPGSGINYNGEPDKNDPKDSRSGDNRYDAGSIPIRAEQNSNVGDIASGPDDGYGGIALYEKPDGTFEYFLTSGDVSKEEGPHGFMVFDGGFTVDTGATYMVGPAASIPSVPSSNTANNRDYKGVGGDIEVLSVLPVSIGSVVWEDNNLDGVQDAAATEPRIAGAVVKLLVKDAAGNFVPAKHLDGSNVSDITTDATGQYLFDDLPEGDYKVQVTPPASYVQSPVQTTADNNDAEKDSNIASSPSAGVYQSGVFTLIAGTEPIEATTIDGDDADDATTRDDKRGNMTVDFGFYQPGSWSGNVSKDNDNDDIGDENLAGVSIELFTDPNGDGNPADGVSVGTTTTDANGNYSFIGLTPSDYVAVETQPAGLLDVSENEGGADNDKPDNAIVNAIAGTVDAGETDTNNDFVEEEPLGAISGNVSKDTNNDDAGDENLSGVTIELFADTDGDGQPDGAAIATTVTDADGNFVFADLQPGDYVVVETQPAGLNDVSENEGGADDDKPDNGTINSIAATVNPGETDTNNDFVEEEPLGAISGNVSKDTNNDDAGDENLSGVTIELFADTDGDGQPDGAAIATTVTDADGNFVFADLQPGDYVVVETQPAGLNDVSENEGGADDDKPDNGTINSIAATVNPGETDTNNDFVEEEPLGAISGNVSKDTNNDDAGDENLSGVTIELFADTDGDGQPDGAAIATTVTDADGNFVFADLQPGDYVVVETQPAGLNDVSENEGGADDDKPDNGTINSIAATVNPGETDTNNDFVEEEPLGAISGNVSKDTNNDDAGDENLSGVTIELFADTDGDGQPDGAAIATTVTDADGNFVFADLQPGDYVVVETQPAGLNDVSENEGGADDDKPDNGTINSIAATVNPGETDTNNDFVEEEPLGAISGNVSKDTNNDDAGDENLSGVTIELFADTDGDGQPDGAAIATTVTDADGNFVFADLQPGDYVVVETQPAGLNDVSENEGGADDDKPDNGTINSIAATVNPGETDTNNDFVEEEPLGAISGNVSKDTNNDDAGDENLSGVTIELFADTDGDGQPDGAAIATTVTDADGNFVFADLQPGDYVVVETQPAGLNDVSENEGGADDDKPDNGTINSIAATVNPGETDTNNDFVEEEPLGAISGNVSKDTNNDDAGDENLSGVTIELFADTDGDGQPDGAAIATTVTDADGNFVFADLQPGDYVVVETQPAGLNDVSENEGGADDDKPDNGTINSIAATVNPGETDTNNDFVEEEPLGAISGNVSKDTNNDDAGDENLSGVTIELFADTDGDGQPDGAAIATTVTDADGNFVFADLQPGDYVVVETQPAGLNDVSENEGGADDDKPDNGTINSIAATVNPGETDTNNDFVEEEPLGAISGNVSKDTNNDDAGDENLSGVTIELFADTDGDGQPDGAAIATTVTDADGNFVFADLQPGDYVVVETQPAGLNDVSENEGGADDDKPDNGTINSIAATVNPGETDTNNDFVEEEPLGAISGNVSKDTNNDDAGDENLSGVTIELFADTDGDGQPDGAAIATTVTDADGNFVFADLQPGDYVVVETQPAGLNDVSENEGGADDDKPDNGTINSIAATVNPGETDTNNDFVEEEPLGAISGNVSKDTNNDDAGDENLSGVTIELFADTDGDGQPDGAAIATTVTDADGNFVFADLQPGDYVVVETQPAGLNDVSENEGGADDDKPDNGTINSIAATVNPGETDTNNDFVEEEPLGAISGNVSKDTNNDDAGDENLSGVTIELFADTDGDGQPDGAAIATTVTDADGNFVFADLQPGDYVVVETQPAGLNDVSENEGGADDDKPDNGTINSIAATVNPGETDTNNDFVEEEPLGAISGNVSKDTNNDDAGDENLSGVTIELFADTDGDGQPDGAAIATTVTDADGNFVFADLQPGDYVVVETQPAGLNDVSENEGGADDDKPDNGTINSIAATVNPGETDTNNDFVEEEPLGAISGNVSKDTNNDDAGDENLSGVTIELFADTDGDGQPDGAAIATTVTDADGNFVFADLQPGDYVVVETQPAGLNDVSENEGGADDDKPDNGTINSIAATVNPGETDTNNDFVEEEPLGAISGNVSKDTNNDDAGDENLSGVTIELFADTDGDGQPDGAAIATTVTDADGNFVFADLQPGDYVVVETQPAGLNDVSENEGGADDDKPDNGTINSIAATVNPGETDTNNDFVEEEPLGAISGNVSKDTNNDDAGDENLSGVTIELFADTDGDGQPDGAAIATTVTDADGNFVFADLQPGDYVVVETQPAGLNDVSENEGGADDDKPDNGTINSIAATVNPGETDTNNDFVEEEPLGAISGNVSKDTNNDDAGDENLSGVTIELFADTDGDGQPDGAAIATTVTDADGNFVFADLQPGDYVVVETQPAGLNDVSENEGGADDDKPDNGTINSIAATVNPGETDTNNDFVEEEPLGAISGNVSKDTNNDDAGDENLSGVTIELFADTDGDGQPDGAAIATTVTDADGNFVFADLQPGDYVVVETQPAGLNDVSENEGGADDDKPDNGTINSIAATVNPGETDTNNDFVEEEPLGAISGNVSKDTNNDDAGDENLSGVTIELFADTDGDGQPDGAAIATTVTDADGNFVFADLQPGDYVVVETQPAGLNDVSENEGGADDDKPDNGTINSIAATVNPGETDTNNDFVEEEPLGAISGNVSKDTNNDDAGDENLSGVTIELFADTDGDGQPDGAAIATTVTDADGNFVFADLQPGDYVVVETQPAGLNDVSENEGGADDDKPDNGTINSIAATVNPGETDTNNDFVEEAPGSWSGNVSKDNDNDDIGDENLAGVSIELFTDPNGDGNPADGVSVGTTTTDANGNYSFTGLTPGDYVAVETQPAGLLDVSENEGGADNDKPDNATVNAIAGTVDAGENDANNDFVERDAIFDLAMVKTLNAGTVTPIVPGADVIFDIKVINQGTVDATDIQINEYIPTGLILNDAAWTENAGVATLNTPIATLAAGAETTVTVTMTVDSNFQGASITNNAEIESASNTLGLADVDSTPNSEDGSTPDTQNDDTASTTGGDDYDPETINLGQTFDLAMVKTLNAGTVTPIVPGADVIFDIKVINQGTVDATDIQINEYIPTGLILNDAAWTENAGVATLNTPIATLAAGAETTVTVTMTVDSNFQGASITNNAEIESASNTLGLADVDSTPNSEDGSTPDTQNDDTASTTGGDDYDPETITIQSLPVKIGDLVWIEEDNDGNAETGTITYPPVGTVVTATAPDGTGYTGTTDADGHYEIVVPANTTYIVTVDTPSGTIPTEGSTDNDVTDATSENNMTHNGAGTTVNVGTTDNMTLDFGFTPPPVPNVHIGDLVWIEEDNDGNAETGRITYPPAGTVVTATAPDGTVYTGTTDANGHYDIEVPANDTYTVTIATPEGYLPTEGSDDNSVPDDNSENSTSHDGAGTTVVVGTTDNMTLDFGFTEEEDPVPTTTAIGNLFWVDDNANGVVDNGEKGYNGVKVTLFDDNGNVLETQTTRNGPDGKPGYYLFDNLTPGQTYQVHFDYSGVPSLEDYVYSPSVGGNNANNADDKGFTVSVTPQAGQQILTIDAGIHCGCSHVSSDGSNALGLLGMLAMMLMTLMTALFFVRKEEEQRV